MKSIFIVIIIMMGSFASAESKCQILDVVRCLCKASMRVSCDSETGYIDNETKVSSVTLKVVTDVGIEKTVTVTNPPNGIRSYAEPLSDPWVMGQLKSQGLEHIKSVDGVEFITNEKPKLYGNSKEEGGNTETATIDGYECTMNAEGTVKNGVCTIPVSCRKGNDYQPGSEATCRALAGKICQPLAACLKDSQGGEGDTATSPSKAKKGTH